MLPRAVVPRAHCGGFAESDEPLLRRYANSALLGLFVHHRVFSKLCCVPHVLCVCTITVP